MDKRTTIALFAVILPISCLTSLYCGYRLSLVRRGKKDLTSPPASPRHRIRTYNPPEFSDCIRLQRIFQDVKNHIVGSSTTQFIYLLICQTFHRQLDNQDLSKPSNKDILDILSSSWPTLVPLPERMMDGHLGVIWGHTDKAISASELQLNPDLVVAFEAAPEGSNLHILLQTILVITLFHEICHHFMKIMFHSKTTPPGCGPEAAGSIGGESGALLEELLVGGVVSVVRKNSECDEGEMEKIQELVLGYKGCNRKLTVSQCRAFLDSITTETLEAFPFAPLQPYVEKKGHSRFRLFNASEDQIPKPSAPPQFSSLSRGLGLRIMTADENVLS